MTLCKWMSRERERKREGGEKERRDGEQDGVVKVRDRARGRNINRDNGIDAMTRLLLFSSH